MANTTGRKPHKAVEHMNSPSSYALLLSGCTNYAFYVFYARRNRRNSPSMARFLLAPPWTAGQGVMRHGWRIKAGFVKHRKHKEHNSYSILVMQRSEHESMCTP